MKKRIVGIMAAALALLMLGLPLVSCGSSRKAVMTLGEQSLTLNMYEFFLTRQRGTLSTTYYYGSDANNDSFWDTMISSDGKTYNDFWTSYISEASRIYLVALYLFEEVYKLELSDDTVAAVDEKLTELVDYDADGSRSAFDAILSNYGINYKMLREVYLLEEKVNYLQEYLYGTDLSKVSDAVKEEYYQENYYRFKQVFVANYYYVYETDADGTVIYCDSESGNPVYDSEGGTRRFDEDGKALKDENGTVIYYDEDGKIAYDTKNGVPLHTYDEDGMYVTQSYGVDEMKTRLEKAEDIMEFTEVGDTATFEDYIEKFSDEDGNDTYPNGYYLPVTSQYSYEYLNDIVAELSEMEVGDIRIVQSEYGYHIVMKYELDEGAYSVTDNEVWFEDFTSMVVQWLFDIKCSEYIDSVVVDEELLGTVDIKSVNPNYNY